MKSELILNCGSFEALSENEIMQIDGGGTFSWAGLGGSMVAGGVTGGLAGVAIGGIGAVPGLVGGACLGGIAYCITGLLS